MFSFYLLFIYFSKSLTNGRFSSVRWTRAKCLCAKVNKSRLLLPLRMVLYYCWPTSKNTSQSSTERRRRSDPFVCKKIIITTIIQKKRKQWQNVNVSYITPLCVCIQNILLYLNLINHRSGFFFFLLTAISTLDESKVKYSI